MSVPGKEVFRCYDAWGVIRVCELPPYRYLAFGDGGEQSCMLIGAPDKLIHQYTQAMMLALLFAPSAPRAAVLGLGAGSLVNALLALEEVAAVTAVERSPQVARVARDWFEFTPTARLTLALEDAESYLAGCEQRFDLLLADLYNDDGMEACQQSPAFLSDCWHCLSEQGVLVLNLWSEGRPLRSALHQTLAELFGDALCSCRVEEGNIILFAFKGGRPALSSRRLLAPARRLGKRLGFALHKLLERLQPV